MISWVCEHDGGWLHERVHCMVIGPDRVMFVRLSVRATRWVRDMVSTLLLVICGNVVGPGSRVLTYAQRFQI